MRKIQKYISYDVVFLKYMPHYLNISLQIPSTRITNYLTLNITSKYSKGILKSDERSL